MESSEVKAFRFNAEQDEKRGNAERLKDAMLHQEISGALAGKNLTLFAQRYPAMAARLIAMDERIVALEKAVVELANLAEGGVPNGRVGKLLDRLGIRKN
jgi:hypothetical protein